MKKVIAIISSIVLALTIGVSVPASATVLSSTPTITPAKSSDYRVKNKNRYWNAVKRMDSDALIVGKKGVIEMGVLTCDLLRAGGTVYDLADLVIEADPIIEDLLTVSVALAPIYLCKDQQYKFD